MESVLPQCVARALGSLWSLSLGLLSAHCYAHCKQQRPVVAQP